MSAFFFQNTDLMYYEIFIISINDFHHLPGQVQFYSVSGLHSGTLWYIFTYNNNSLCPWNLSFIYDYTYCLLATEELCSVEGSVISLWILILLLLHHGPHSNNEAAGGTGAVPPWSPVAITWRKYNFWLRKNPNRLWCLFLSKWKKIDSESIVCEASCHQVIRASTPQVIKPSGGHQVIRRSLGGH